MTYSPNTPKKLSETWADLLSNPEKIQKLSRDGYEGTKKYFNIHNQAAEMIGLYESLQSSL